VELRPIDLDDLPLYEAIHCDPAMMEHLGGPLPREGLAEKLRRDVATTAAGETWVLKIILDRADGLPQGAVAGTVSVWDHENHDDPTTEIGWMVLPSFQGHGVGSRAVRAVLDRARSEARWSVIHAFPPVSNPRSNAMCRKMGFTFVEEQEFLFRDRPLRCNVWRLDLRGA
jgi:RimJ/RimL family protein N-acetyltransferase